MSTVVRFKDEEKCPCPLPEETPEESVIWSRVRGKPVRIGKVLPLSEIPEDSRCGSDTYWEIEDQWVRDLVLSIHGACYDQMQVCRHQLEMGD